MVKSRIDTGEILDPKIVRERLRKGVGRLLKGFRTELMNPGFLRETCPIGPIPIVVIDQDEFAYILCRISINPKGVLSEREVRVAIGVRDGLANKTIAQNLGLSARTVAAHLERIYARLRIKSRLELALLAERFEPVLQAPLSGGGPSTPAGASRRPM